MEKVPAKHILALICVIGLAACVNSKLSQTEIVGTYLGTYTIGSSDPSGQGDTSTLDDTYAQVTSAAKDFYQIFVFKDAGLVDTIDYFEFDLSENPIKSCEQYFNRKVEGVYVVTFSEISINNCDSLFVRIDRLVGQGRRFYAFEGERIE